MNLPNKNFFSVNDCCTRGSPNCAPKSSDNECSFASSEKDCTRKDSEGYNCEWNGAKGVLKEGGGSF